MKRWKVIVGYLIGMTLVVLIHVMTTIVQLQWAELLLTVAIGLIAGVLLFITMEA